jgi:short subunit dehydrogenase-like uncharacterized protein
MPLNDRKYDLVLYGASGFTGRQTVQYCKQFAPPGLRWAIAGRSRSKLDSVKPASVDVIVADAQDDTALDALAQHTRVVASTAGPFSLYGSRLVEACVRNRTHYCDITGETPWIRGLIDRHHAQAAADGTRIVPCCGFDSIPSDYGAWRVSRYIHDVLHSDCVRISAYFRLGRGGINGGTVASGLHLAESGQLELTREPYLLDPNPASHTPQERARNADPTSAQHDADLQAWVAPFIMGPVNTRVVRRTQALLGTHYDYQEYGRFAGAGQARAAVIGGKVFGSLLRSRFGRRILKSMLPDPGEGPSQKAMDDGFFECEFIGSANSGARVRGILKGKGDAGNRITVKCLCESAFVLALSNAAQSAAKPSSGGVLTPMSAMGDELAARLESAGIQFQFV